jgi:uncharacterized protein (DUF433 family)
MMSARKILGRFIVIVPNVRGGEPTFRGTRLTVREAVELIAQGQSWDQLIERNEGALSRRAIAEALALCVDAFLAETDRLRERRDPSRLELSETIVMDPAICHGKPTYKGSRVMVWQVLHLLEQDRSWRSLREGWPGAVTDTAIAETIELALRMFLERAEEFVADAVSV